MQIDVNSFYSPKDVISKNGGILPISLSAVYTAIASDEIPTISLGGRKLISGAYLQSLVDKAASQVESLNC